MENLIERSVIFCKEPELRIEKSFAIHDHIASEAIKKDLKLETIERDHIIKILNQTNWVIEGDLGAARILDLHPNTLRSRMKKLQILKPTA